MSAFIVDYNDITIVKGKIEEMDSQSTRTIADSGKS
jgi:hypothetical protein